MRTRGGVCVPKKTSNGVYKQYESLSSERQGKTMHYALFFTARPKMCRDVEACMFGRALSVTVIVCEFLLM